MRLIGFGSRKSRKSIWAAMTALLLTLGLSAAQAQQTGAGSIQGTVTDAKGAVIPGATVQVVKTSTLEKFNTTSNSVGFYSVPSLFVGDYSIAVTANGMAKWQASLTLQAGQTAVLDAHLKVGSVTTEVTVAGDQTTTINTEDSVQGSTVGRQ